MPSIDFRALRERVTIQEVLELMEFKPIARRGDQVRGPCPIHGSSSTQSRSFSVNLRLNTFKCFSCEVGGNQLDLWVALNNLPLAEAASALCLKLEIDVPYLQREQLPNDAKTEKRNP